MKSSSTILQVVPQPPGTQDGVGDYALIIARKLRDLYSSDTIFVANESASTGRVSDFEILSPLAAVARNKIRAREFQHVILHYVNYGYQKRGVPFGLLSILRELRKQFPGRLLTIFHELNASGPPWQSAFWLRPFQIRIARSVSQISDACIVSSEAMLAQLQRLNTRANIQVHPVVSNFGEPSFPSDQLAHRDPHCWVICGGTALVERSLRSFRKILDRIPGSFAARELFVFGGNENPAIRSVLGDIANIQTHYRPRVPVAEASQILLTASFAWMDYFRGPGVPTGVILKSGAFAAACAHGVIPIFPHAGSTISMAGDRLPGPFFIDPDFCELPASNNRTRVATEFYNWYRRHASSERLVRGIAGRLGLDAGENIPFIDEHRAGPN